MICHVINLFKSAAGLNLNRAVDKLIPRPTKRNRLHSENDVVLELFLSLKPCQYREERGERERQAGMGTSVQVTPLSGVYNENPLSYLVSIDGFNFLVDCGWNDHFDPSLLQPLARFCSVSLYFPNGHCLTSLRIREMEEPKKFRAHFHMLLALCLYML